ncbi:MAG: ribbon-helix-helix protein, CopG family [Chloroflexota bacterium]|nr:ribbon-helix-helix protein, CopG family [Chloroflexota bacterium]
MSHRTQITLPDSQYARLKRESERTGAGLAELIRHAIAEVYGEVDRSDVKTVLAASFGTWQDRDFDGEEYVERLRRGLAWRLDR